MPKKDKRKVSAKNAKKEEVKLSKKLKKIELDSGDTPIEQLLEELEEKRKKSADVTIFPCEPLSPRSHSSILGCPDTNELIFFGGEYFNGKKNIMYQDLVVFNVSNSSWVRIDSPNTPSPRCSHQTVLSKISNSTVMFLFGGEFASESQSRFHHFKDLWSLSIKSKKWKLIEFQGGPCSRSGHRMTEWRNGFLLFGGFTDSGLKTQYFGDLWEYSAQENFWTKILIPNNLQIAPRSGGALFSSVDLCSVFIIGGYSKLTKKPDDEKGIFHTDHLQIKLPSSRSSAAESGIQISSLRVSGSKPTPPRSGMSAVRLKSGSNQILFFGGVFDEELEDGEVLRSHFNNELLSLELEKGKWHNIISNTLPNTPHPRMHCGLAILNNKLYVYGGTYEKNDIRVTLNDLHSIELSNPTAWEILYPGSTKSQEWFESDEDDHMDSDSSSDDEIDAPLPVKGESVHNYTTRTLQFWCELVQEDDDDAAVKMPSPSADVLSLATKMAEHFFAQHN